MNTVIENAHNGRLKIAILRALYLGDMLCIIPAVRAIRSAFPEAHITLIGLPWQREFVQRFLHYFDDFVACPGLPSLVEQPLDAGASLAFLQDMQARQFDYVFQMQGNGAITNAMCMLFGAGKVLGLRKPDDFCPDARMFPVSADDDHEILRFLKLADALGLPRCGVDLELPVTDAELRAFDEISGRLGLVPRKYICLHPGARDRRRRWPAECFAKLGDDLGHEGYTLLLTGSAGEELLLRQVEEHMKRSAVNLVAECGHTGLGELALLIRHAAFLVTNDTGVSHIAAAVNTPSIVLFSEYSRPSRWAPLDATRHQVMSFHEARFPGSVTARVLGFLSPSGHPQLLSSV